MNEHPLKLKEDILAILRLLSFESDLTQRDLANQLSFSLGKTNYLLKALALVGFLEIRNFSVRNHKAQKVRYLLTKKGLGEKARLTYHFLKEKEREYNFIMEEWKRIRGKVPLNEQSYEKKNSV